MLAILTATCALLATQADAPPKGPPALPNIVLILADDLGYGDVGCYNPEAKVPTPNLDRLAREGMRFTDAHSPCTVCTPTRYALMTGQMPFCVPRGGSVFAGVGGPSLIAPSRLTLPEMLRDKGYATAAVGKWHVGLSFFDAAGQRVTKNGNDGVAMVDFARRIEGGPLDHGFDSFFGTACCPTTDWLYAFLEGDRIPVPPTRRLDKSTLPEHPYANDCRPGLIAEDFAMEEVDLRFLERSQRFLRDHVRTSPERPFFLYHAAQAVHLPSFAAKRFQGKTKAGPHGDFLFQLDWMVGELMQTLEDLGVADRTLVLFTSDNGPETTSVIHMRADHGHDGARPWRGVKRDQWEGGHRVPLIARWPGNVPPGTTSDQLTSLTDVMATCAAIVGAQLPDDAAEDSFDMLPALRGEAHAPIRPYVLQQAFSASALSIRKGRWKYLDHRGSGGNNYERGPLLAFALPELAPDAPGQLYDLERDPGETRNLYLEQPEVVAELSTLLAESKAAGRSRPVRDTNPPPSRPHVVFLLADDLGYADCGFNGGTQIATPQLDALARAGTILDAFYAQPVCSPTRAALLTGRYPMRHGLQVGVITPGAKFGLPLDERTLAEALRDAGYATALTGKWHLGEFDAAYLPHRRGFDQAYGHYFGALDYHTHLRNGIVDWYRNGERVLEEGYTTHLLAREAVRIVERHDADQPLFLYVPFNAIHTPLHVPDRYLAPYQELPEPRRKIAGMLAAMDEAVGQIVGAIAAKGMRERTLFVFASDNGGPNPGRLTDNGPLRGGKAGLYEGGVRVCAFATWDGVIPAGKRVAEPLHVVDWYPTLLRLAGGSLAPDVQRLPLDGRDLWPTLVAGAPSPHDEILLNASPKAGAIRVGTWKLKLAISAAGERVELFDLATDIGETENLAEAHPERVKDLRARYDRLAAQAVSPKNDR